MQPSELELYTTQELVHELLRRKTFQGVLVHSEQDCREKEWHGEKIFQVHFNDNLTREQACRLLDAVVSWMDREYC